MHLYRFRVFNESGALTRRHAVQLGPDAAAVKIGKFMLTKASPNSTLEIWCLQRCVHYEPTQEGSFVGS